MKTKDFQGFRFGKTHTSDLNLEVVSVSNRYEARTLPSPSDSVSDIPGSDGQYYFGSVNKNREITCNVAFDNVSESIYRKIRQLFATDKLLDLVFDEEPYKTWKAKIKSKPEFKSLCFTDKETGKRVYKGDGRLVFVCYFPYAFGFDKYIVRTADYYMLNTPECIIQNLQEDDETFVKKEKENLPIMPPEDIRYHYNLNPSDYEGGIFTNPYRDKDHRNRGERGWDPNGNQSWKTGFPSLEQVQNGELFFDTDYGKKTLINTRGYWDNIPEWEDTAKLLTTPTLDFEQELMYLPQYSKTNYINMETGFDSNNSMIGSRVLVYNPGDLPVDWEIRFDENKRGFWSTRGGTKFRVSRFNVERLPIPCAVDWCGLKTQDPADDEKYKYGTKYFKRRGLNLDVVLLRYRLLFSDSMLERYGGEENILKHFNLWIEKPVEEWSGNNPEYYNANEILELFKQKIIPADKNWGNDDINLHYSKDYNWKQLYEEQQILCNKIANDDNTKKEYSSTSINLKLKDVEKGFAMLLLNTFSPWSLGEAHPKHCYYVEPIPKERLDHFIKLFYWQTIQWRGTKTVDQQLIELDNWKKMLPEDFFDKEKLANGEYYIKDINNPLVPFLRNFILFSESGEMMANNSDSTKKLRNIYFDLNFEDGIAFANRYRELYEECIDDIEKYELYWDTLKKLLKIAATGAYNILKDNNTTVQLINGGTERLFSEDEETFINNYIDSYINHPIEYINSDMRDLNYGDFVFNGYKQLGWITEDYVEIDQSKLNNVELIKEYLAAIGSDMDAIFNGKIMYYNRELINSDNFISLRKRMDAILGDGGCLNNLLDDYYYLNSNEHMLYTTANPYGMEFIYKPSKTVMNDAITQGNWFKLPPGWSLITIEPVVDENAWGGKRWEDARPFDYGYSADMFGHKREVQQLFDYVFDQARTEFLKTYPLQDIINKKVVIKDDVVNETGEVVRENSKDNLTGTEDLIDEILKFKIWYNIYLQEYPAEKYYLINSYYKKKQIEAEYTFLKYLNDIWSIIAPYYSWTAQRGVYIEPLRELEEVDVNTYLASYPNENDYDITGLPLRNINGNIGDWWWYACNYFWSNFPPLYWAMADMLNRIQIKYTPLYY